MTGLVDTALQAVGVSKPSAQAASASAVMNTYSRFPLTLVRGKGCWVWDDKGNRYLDAVAGIATDTLGHSDRVMRRSLHRQLRRIQHVSNLYRIPEQEELASLIAASLASAPELQKNALSAQLLCTSQLASSSCSGIR